MYRIEQLLKEFSGAHAPSDCWLWPGGVSGSGYGYIIESSTRKSTGVHRLAWEATNGPIPDGLVVCHTCDVKTCINPAHLWLGTDLENARDKIRKGRARYGNTDLTHCRRGHEFTPDNTYTAPGSGKRYCKACHAARNRTYREAKQLAKGA